MGADRRLVFVIAGDSREVIEKNYGKAIWRTLSDNGFVERTWVGCVGFHRQINENLLIVVLPKAFNSENARARLRNPDYEREQIYRLIRIFRKIRRESEFSLVGGVSNQILDREIRVTDPVLDSFDAALQLRRDFFQNGFYLRKTNRYLYNKPNLPVNWSRTIRHSTVVLNGEEVFFNNTIHTARKRDASHPLYLLHVACLKEIFALTGDRNDLKNANSLDEISLSRIKANPSKHIRRLRALTFDERGRFLLSAITSFFSESRLLGAERQVREELLSYTKDFEDIWERVLRDLISPGIKTRSLPQGEWYSWPDVSASKGIEPKFDIRLQSNDADVLIDAKDFRIFNGAKLKEGGASDHYKQIIYRQLLNKTDNSKVINILAFPSLGQTKLFAIRGCHHWKEIKGSLVFEVTVDYDLAVKRWLRETSLDVNSDIAMLLRDLREFSEKMIKLQPPQ